MQTLKRHLYRMMATLLLMTVMAYSFIGYHHHQGLHVCMAVEHLFYDACAKAGACGETAGGSSHAAGHHVRNCSLSDQYRGVTTQRISVDRHVRDLQPLWLMAAWAFQLCIFFSQKTHSLFVPDVIGRILVPPLGGRRLRAPPFH